MSRPFARMLSPAEVQEAKEREASRLSELRASLSRLVKNEDFRAWFARIDGELCGCDFGRDELSPFTQGKRATASFIRETLAIADGGPAFLAELTRNHFNAVADAYNAARNRKENGEN